MDLRQVGRPYPGAPSSPLCPGRGSGPPPPQSGNAKLGREWVRNPGFQLPCLFCFRVREGCPLASRLCEPPARPAEVGPMRPGQEPRLDLCPSGEGSQVTQPLQGPAGLQGQARPGGEVGSFQKPACGQLGHATGRRAGSGQAAGTPGWAGGVRGWGGGRQTDGS